MSQFSFDAFLSLAAKLTPFEENVWPTGTSPSQGAIY